MLRFKNLGSGSSRNATAAEILRSVRHPGLSRVVAAHLSVKNNSPALAQTSLASALDWPARAITVASQSAGTDWLVVC